MRRMRSIYLLVGDAWSMNRHNIQKVDRVSKDHLFFLLLGKAGERLETYDSSKLQYEEYVEQIKNRKDKKAKYIRKVAKEAYKDHIEWCLEEFSIRVHKDDFRGTGYRINFSGFYVTGYGLIEAAEKAVEDAIETLEFEEKFKAQ